MSLEKKVQAEIIIELPKTEKECAWCEFPNELYRGSTQRLFDFYREMQPVPLTRGMCTSCYTDFHRGDYGTRKN